MSDIDLIPSDYRLGLWLRRSGKRFVAALTLVVIVSVLVLLGLQRSTASVRDDIDGLQTLQAAAVQQREQLNALNDRKLWAQRRLDLLDGLRGGIEAQAMFVCIDRALAEGEVWFTRWEFQRAGSVVPHREEAVETGYFVVLPKRSDEPVTEAWRIETHMSIQGGARDYAALSGFVSRLLAQPEIQSVHVQNTATHDRAGHPTVEFTLAVVVNTGAERS